jgi:hypothetical protein
MYLFKEMIAFKTNSSLCEIELLNKGNDNLKKYKKLNLKEFELIYPPQVFKASRM